MDRATAKARLTNMVAASSRPVLADADLEALCDLARAQDSEGRQPADAGYVETIDTEGLNLAAAEGWRWKAGRVAGDFDFTADDASYSKGEVMARCLDMEARYAAKVTGQSRIVGIDRNWYDAGDLIP